MHFTPTSASWLNMVERFLRDITTERLRRGDFTSVPELVAAINKYVAHHNKEPKPFICSLEQCDAVSCFEQPNRPADRCGRYAGSPRRRSKAASFGDRQECGDPIEWIGDHLYVMN
jgi:hypothetical protein